MTSFLAPLSFSRVAARVRTGAALGLLAGCVLGLGVGVPAQAQNVSAAVAAAPAEGVEDIGSVTRRWLDEALQAAQAESAALRMEVQVGQLDPRLRLAPCARVEPFLPAGTRLWGRTRLGLRCVQGAVQWTVFLPITIQAWGPAWVLADTVSPGTVLMPQHASLSEVDWAAENAPVLAQQQSWVGQVAARQLRAGQALRQSMVRAPELFKAGAQVRVVVQGPGYAVTAAGQALGAGAVGQSVRVRMENGRIVGGTVADNGSVQVPL